MKERRPGGGDGPPREEGGLEVAGGGCFCLSRREGVIMAPGGGDTGACAVTVLYALYVNG